MIVFQLFHLGILVKIITYKCLSIIMSAAWEQLLSEHSFWYGKEPSSRIDVYCMLPNGICISCPSVPADMPLCKIKANVWEEAQRYGLFRLLLHKEAYVFAVVSSNKGVEEILDEDRSLYDVRPFRPYLKIVQRQGDEEEKKNKNDISRLIGRSITTSVKTEEVEEFRIKYKNFCEDIFYQRGRSSWERRAIYTYPPDLDTDEDLSPKLQEKLQACGNTFQVTVSSSKTKTHTLEVHDQNYPQDIIDMAIKKLTLNKQQAGARNDDYVLKVLGRLDFFLGEVTVDEYNQECYVEKHIIQYKYIQDCLMWDKRPHLIMMQKHEMDVGRVRAPTLDKVPPPVPKKEHNRQSDLDIILWNIAPATMFKIKVQCAMNINAGQMWKEVHCGLFHGGEEICAVTQTTQRQKGIHPCWNEYLELNLPVARLPRMAKLCFCIVGYKQEKDTKKRRTPAVPIAWVNCPVFNFKGRLNVGINCLECWPSGVKHSGSHQFLNPIGTVASGGNDKGPCLLIEFMKFSHTIVYPSDDFVLEIAALNRDQSKHPPLVKGRKQHRMQIEGIVKKDALMPMFEEDKELLWRLRAECCHDYPESLPKLLECVKWDSREDVAQIYFLLQSWRYDLEIEIALNLLDYKFPDIKVRSLAVRILDNLMDGELEMYLLQLVQALKYELYLDSPLAKYLLRRALNNKRIGHYLFWHLKAEVCNPECSLQFGLLLEMYCRGAVNHVPSLLRQVEAINKLKTVTEILQSYKDQDNAKKLDLMRQCFYGDSYVNAFSDLISPIDPSIRLRKLRVQKCKYMSSKKKPLWLVFENVDEGADLYVIMFKNGDDLRQDMLTLLSLRLMDKVWKKAGLDYGIIPYKCLSTGPMVGLIEVVPNSETLGRIQAARGAFKGVWNEKNLHLWLSEKCNGNDEKLDRFMKSFIRSVVGYSIATYVLGVGDRHNDNIMMKFDTGQLFHIDFGHFLGNFKTKWGIRRERVKFVLTSDILYVIKQCRSHYADENFEIFKNMCVEAFKALRSKGNLFITVFAMLLPTGIPELELPENLDYLRDSLALVSDELEAVKHFEKSFNEANHNKMKTTMNWMFHNLNHHWIG